ncbi:MAG: hypothetical protein J7L44_03980 [Candidatus Diapherotrites archaeon]|nr:hypothetical protein [Candidatus Diapherotrites archaeon]
MMLAVFRNQKLKKYLFLFIIAFGIGLLLIYSIVPAAPNVKLILNASQLEHHSLFVVPPGSLQIDFYNDTEKQCVFVMFPYANAGNIKTKFIKSIEPGQRFPFSVDVASGDAYAVKCAEANLGFAWKDLPVLVVAESNEIIWHIEIKNGTLWDMEKHTRMKELTASPGQKLWFIVKNSDKNYWSFDLVISKKQVAEKGMPLKIYRERYWPPLKKDQVLVMGPISLDKVIYSLSIIDFYCKENCRRQSAVRLLVK